MKSMLFLWSSLGLCLFYKADPIVINNTRGADYAAIPNIRLSVEPPPGFIFLPPDDAFTRGGTPVSSSRYVLKAQKLNLDYAMVMDSLTKGISADAIQDYIINKYTGVMINRTIAVGSETINLFTLAFGNNYYTYVLNAYCPAADPATRSKLSAALLSAYVDTLGAPSSGTAKRNKTMQPRAQRSLFATSNPTIDFSLDLSGTTFKQASVIGPLFAYFNLDGVYPPIGNDKSFLRVYAQTASVTQDGQASFSQAILSNYTEFSRPSNVQIQPTNVATDGLTGYEVTCNATDGSGNEVQVYQKSLFSGDTVYLLTGVYYPSAGSNEIPVFKRVFNSFKRIQ